MNNCYYSLHFQLTPREIVHFRQNPSTSVEGSLGHLKLIVCFVSWAAHVNFAMTQIKTHIADHPGVAENIAPDGGPGIDIIDNFRQ